MQSLGESRTSTILKSAQQDVQIDPEQVSSELFDLLTQKSSKFMLGGRRHEYDHKESIFFRTGPIAETLQKATKKCPSCHHVFASRTEMVFCSFCGFSNDSKCVQKTKLYPQAASAEENKSN